MSERLSTSHRVYLILSGTIFFMVAILHLLRLVFHWQIILGPLVAPFWVSYVGFPVALAYCMWAGWLYRK
ncbi:hypothetical protein ES703_27906 [subsurface metagenome]